MERTLLRLNNEFSTLTFDDFDTLVYIGPHSQTPGEDDKDYALTAKHFNVPHRMRSSRLQELSPSKFDYLLGPKSVRTERQFKRRGIYPFGLQNQIKFCVDLRPPTEDEDAIILVTSLSCAKGLLDWHHAKDKYGLAAKTVGGVDNASLLPTDFPLPTRRVKEENSENDMKKTKESSNIQSPDKAMGTQTEPIEVSKPKTKQWSAEPEPEATGDVPAEQQPPVLAEYSSLRHHSAIERLLQAIEYGDPKLDSAPKVWTFYAVAKFYDCAQHERIAKWIDQWLLTYPNSNFIQANPEVAYRMAMGTMSEAATKGAFSILVGEKALLNVFGEADSRVLARLEQSIHGRILQLLDDDERNRIDHAAASLVRRIRSKFGDLTDEHMSWLTQSEVFRSIIYENPQSEEEAKTKAALILFIKRYIRGRIYWVLCRHYTADFEELEQNLASVENFYPFYISHFYEVFNRLNQRERLFTRTFWLALFHEDFRTGDVNTFTYTGHSDTGAPVPGNSKLAQGMLDARMPSGERYVQVLSRFELTELVRDFNAMKARHAGVDHAPFLQRPSQGVNSPSNTVTQKHAPSKIEDFVSTGVKARKLSHSHVRADKPPKHGESRRNPTEAETEQILSLYDKKNQTLASYDRNNTRDVEAQSTAQALPVRKKRDRTSQDTPHQPSTLRNVAGYLESNRRKVNDEEAFCSQAQEYNALRHASTEPPEVQTDSRSDSSRVLEFLPGEMAYALPSAESENQYSHVAASAVTAQSNRGSAYVRSQDGSYFEVLKRDLRPQYTQAPLRVVNPNVDIEAEAASTTAIHNGIADDPENYDWPAGLNSFYTRFQRPHTPPVHDGASEQSDDSETEISSDFTRVSKIRGRRTVQQFSDTEPPGADNLRRSDRVAATIAGISYVNVDTLLGELTHALQQICNDVLFPPHLFHGDSQLPVNLVDTLLCLEDEEWKYLPLWAGGCDDGTGGVFDEVDVPNLEAGGFKGGKRGIGNVNSGTASSTTDSSFDDIGSEARSTVGRASKVATDGTRTVVSIDTESEAGPGEETFQEQSELWEQLRAKTFTGKEDKGKGRAVEDEEEAEVETVVAAPDEDEDEDEGMGMVDDDEDDREQHFDDDDEQRFDDSDEDEDDDLDIITKDDL